MLIRVNPKGDAPLYRQVMTQIQALIAAGKLRVGDRLPSVRELAVDLRINPNTVARAYRELDRLGVLETRGASGSFVAAGQARGGRRLREQEYRERLQEALDAAVSMGLNERQAREIFEEGAQRSFDEGGEADEQQRASGG